MRFADRMRSWSGGAVPHWKFMSRRAEKTRDTFYPGKMAEDQDYRAFHREFPYRLTGCFYEAKHATQEWFGGERYRTIKRWQVSETS